MVTLLLIIIFIWIFFGIDDKKYNKDTFDTNTIKKSNETFANNISESLGIDKEYIKNVINNGDSSVTSDKKTKTTMDSYRASFDDYQTVYNYLEKKNNGMLNCSELEQLANSIKNSTNISKEYICGRYNIKQINAYFNYANLVSSIQLIEAYNEELNRVDYSLKMSKKLWNLIDEKIIEMRMNNSSKNSPIYMHFGIKDPMYGTNLNVFFTYEIKYKHYCGQNINYFMTPNNVQVDIYDDTNNYVILNNIGFCISTSNIVDLQKHVICKSHLKDIYHCIKFRTKLDDINKVNKIKDFLLERVFIDDIGKYFTAFINDDYSIDIENTYKDEFHTDIGIHILKELPEYIKFHICNCNLFITNSHVSSDYPQIHTLAEDYESLPNEDIISLKGCPTIVNGNFSCNHSGLLSLIGCPSEITGTFKCKGNKFSSLVGFPKKIGYGVTNERVILIDTLENYNVSVEEFMNLDVDIPKVINGKCPKIALCKP